MPEIATINNSTYRLTSTCGEPRIKLLDGSKTSYIPCTTGSEAGFRISSNNTVYRPLIYQSTSVSHYITTSTTCYSSLANGSAGLSNVTALTRSSTYYASGENIGAMSSTTALTRGSTYNTIYETRQSVSNIWYRTRESVSNVWYRTRESTYGYQTLGTNLTSSWEYYQQSRNYTYHVLKTLIGAATSSGLSAGQIETIYSQGNNYYTVYTNYTHTVYYGAFNVTSCTTYQRNAGSPVTDTQSMIASAIRNETKTQQPGSTTYTIVVSACNSETYGNALTSASTYETVTETRASTYDTVYETRASVSNTIYETRSSTSGYSGRLSRQSISGYSGISTSSRDSSSSHSEMTWA